MVNIQAHVGQGSVKEKKKTRVDYDVTHPTFHADLSRQAVYSFVVTGGIHTDRFSLHRDGTGKEIIDDELNVSFETPSLIERLKLALAMVWPKYGEKYGATLVKYGLKDEQIDSLQPQVDKYNTECGIGIQCEYLHPESVEERVIPVEEAGLASKL